MSFSHLWPYLTLRDSKGLYLDPLIQLNLLSDVANQMR